MEPDPGSQSSVSQVSRVRAPVMPTGLPRAAPAALPTPAPSLTVYLLLEPHLHCFAHRSYQDHRELGKVMFPC